MAGSIPVKRTFSRSFDELAAIVVAQKLSVRATEQRVRALLREDAPTPKPEPDARHQIIVRDLEDRLRKHLGVKVALRTGKDPKGAGRIEVSYRNLDELNRVLQSMLGGDV